MNRLFLLALAAGFDDIAAGNSKIADSLRTEAEEPPDTPVDSGGTVDEPEEEEDDMNGGQLMGGESAFVGKAIQFDSSTESLTVATGTALDDGAGALDACTFIYECRPNASTVELVYNGANLNGSGLHVRITGDKTRAYCGTASNQQKYATGDAVWPQGEFHRGAVVWDGSDIVFMRDGELGTSGAQLFRSASPKYLDDLRFNQGDDDHDLRNVALVRKALTVGEVNAIQDLMAAGNYIGAGALVHAHNSASGCVVGPTAEDDSTVVSNGIVEHCAGRTTATYGAPDIIDMPA